MNPRLMAVVGRRFARVAWDGSIASNPPMSTSVSIVRRRPRRRGHPRGRLLLVPGRKRELPPLLRELAPSRADELRDLLQRAGHPQLAFQVATLPVVERCPCGDPACASFYAVPPRQTLIRFARGGYTINLAPSHGTLSVDVLDRRIVAVEVIEHTKPRD
jgi:hypothetical protein